MELNLAQDQLQLLRFLFCSDGHGHTCTKNPETKAALAHVLLKTSQNSSNLEFSLSQIKLTKHVWSAEDAAERGTC